MSKDNNEMLDRVRSWLDRHQKEERAQEIGKALAAFEANRLKRVQLKDALETNTFEGKLLRKELERAFKAGRRQQEKTLDLEHAVLVPALGKVPAATVTAAGPVARKPRTVKVSSPKAPDTKPAVPATAAPKAKAATQVPAAPKASRTVSRAKKPGPAGSDGAKEGDK